MNYCHVQFLAQFKAKSGDEKGAVCLRKDQPKISQWSRIKHVKTHVTRTGIECHMTFWKYLFIDDLIDDLLVQSSQPTTLKSDFEPTQFHMIQMSNLT